MLIDIIIASLLVSCTSLVGGFLLIWRRLLTKNILPYLVGFAAGVVLVVAFLDLLPEAVELAEEPGNVFLAVLFGVLLSFFVERFLLWFHHHDESHTIEPSSVLILFGDSLHNFIDGVVIAAAFISSPGSGIIITLAVAAHEIPHEIADFAVLIHGGMNKSKALFYNFLSSLTALVGAIGGYFFLTTINTSLSYLLAFSGGMFIYIACADLIPDLHRDFTKEKRWRQTLTFIAGLVIAYIVLVLFHTKR